MHFILVGILSVLGIITLRNEVAGASEGTVAYTLAAIEDWTFLLGPGWVIGWGNGLILGYLMYRSGLVRPGSASSSYRPTLHEKGPGFRGLR
jgi:hypothetical protein